VTSLLAIFALLAGKYLGWAFLDPLMGVAGAVLVAKWSLGLLRSSSHVLLDMQAPEEIRLAIKQAIEAKKGKADQYGVLVLDYDATLEALRLMNSPDGLGIGARHLTISTCGLVTGIRRLAGESEQFTLAVSLHSAVQSTRDRLMPGASGMPLAELHAALAYYSQHSGRRPSLEYAMISGVNDTEAEFEALAAFCAGLLCHVNLIPVNEVAGTGFARSSESLAAQFARRLAASGIEASVRAERGADIDAACGQLRQRAV